MKNFRVAILLLAGGAVLASPADEQAIRSLIDNMQASWNRHDIHAFASNFAADGEVIPPLATLMAGRSEIEKQFTELHKGMLKNSQLSSEGIEIRFVKPDIAVVHLKLTDDLNIVGPDGKKLPPARGLASMVVQKRDGAWQIQLEQVTVAPPRPGQ